jgi:hypothetical protein
MEVGQLILLKNIDRIGGRRQPITKTIRPAVVIEILGENIVNVRLVSTIYVNEKVKPKNLEFKRKVKDNETISV